MDHHTPTIPGPEPDDGAAQGTASRDSSGRRVGPYRLLDKLGEGGMGEVWRAEQTAPVRRIVAVKLVKPGMDSRQVIARFEAERQALALMEHPCIAKVLDAGTTPEGRPYFAMEYVAGVPITTYCDRRRLGTRERLELFRRVCEGVQHAHQKAVLHRDLKPGNVLVTDVDGRPLPKVIDFGVAKATTQPLTDATMQTALGQILGTPAYMSPEQADLTGEDVDTRTDVYSLGVILYELLAGALPFDPAALRRAGFEGIRRMLREQEPPKPSTRVSTLGERSGVVAADRGTTPRLLRQHLRGDLDWIVMRALEKDRNRRYGSPQDLARDVARHLAHEPVEAGPPGAAYRARKFVRRHRTAVAATSAIAVLLIAFAVTSLHQARTVARERDRAEDEAAKAKAMNDFLRNMLVSADPWTGGGRDVTVASVLDASAREVERSFVGQPLLEADMRAVLGSTYLGLGLLPRGAAQTRRALDLRVQALGTEHPDVAESWRTMANVEYEQRDDAAALRAAREAVRILERHGGDARPRVNALLMLAQCQVRAREFAGADSTLDRVDRLCAELPDDARPDLAQARMYRADVAAAREGGLPRADSLLVAALDLYRAVDPQHAQVPVALNNLAIVRMNRGRLDEAQAAYDEALAAAERRWGTDHPTFATLLENSGNVAFLRGDHDSCVAGLRRVLDIRRRNLGPDNAQVLRTMQNLAVLTAAKGDPAGAVALLEEVEPRLRALNGDEHADVVVLLRNKAWYLQQVGRLGEAVGVLAEAETLGARVHGEAHAEVAALRVDRAMCLAALQRWREAEALLDAAFPVLLAAHGESDPATALAAEALVAVYERTGRPERAAAYRQYLPPAAADAAPRER